MRWVARNIWLSLPFPRVRGSLGIVSYAMLKAKALDRGRSSRNHSISKVWLSRLY